MIFNNQGIVYSRIEFKNEEEVEQVVLDNFRLLFGDYSILLPKGLITNTGGKGTIPDGIIINFEEEMWYILEVERGIHGTWEHIAPQVVKQITAMQNIATKNRINENCIKEIRRKKGFTALLGEIDFEEIFIHMDYSQKEKPKTRFEGTVRIDGIEVDDTVSSPSTSSLRCIQQVNPERTSSNGWVSWKTEDGLFLDEALKGYIMQKRESKNGSR